MNRRFASIFLMILLAVSVSACNLTTSGVQVNSEETRVAIQVQATMLALQATMQAAAPAGEATAVPQPQGDAAAQLQGDEPTGAVAGELSFPSEGIPGLRIVAFEVAEGRPTGQYYYIETTPGQAAYQMNELPATTYFMIAYTLPDSSEPLAAGYTQAVECGLTADCTDHNLIPVEVSAGQVTQGIHLTDWYAPPENFPNDPVG